MSKKSTSQQKTSKRKDSKDKGLNQKKLSDQVRKSIERYFKDLNGELPCNVYQLVLSEIEKPLLEVVMNYTEHNQSQASRILGINRNTLRKKLENYRLN